MPGNPSPNTWEVRKLKLNGTWPWVNLEANDFISHGIVKTNVLQAETTSGSSGVIASYDNLIPAPAAQLTRQVNLGSTAYEWDNLYVKNLHVSGTNNIGSPSIQAGTGTTNSTTGVATITFAKAFSAAPVVTVTIYDQNDTSRPIIAKLTNVTTTGFSVFTMHTLTRQHKHKTGKINSSAAYSGNVQYYRNLEVIDSGGSQAAVGGVIAATGQSAYDTYTDTYTPTAGEPSMVPQAANFHWIATAKTQ